MRVGEDAHVVEPDGFDERLQLGEVCVRLAREADDEGRTERDARNPLPDPIEQPLVAGARARPLHPLEHRVRGVLQRQVDVLADLLALCHRVEHVVLIVVG